MLACLSKWEGRGGRKVLSWIFQFLCTAVSDSVYSFELVFGVTEEVAEKGYMMSQFLGGAVDHQASVRADLLKMQFYFFLLSIL